MMPKLEDFYVTIGQEGLARMFEEMATAQAALALDLRYKRDRSASSRAWAFRHAAKIIRRTIFVPDEETLLALARAKPTRLDEDEEAA